MYRHCTLKKAVLMQIKYEECLVALIDRLFYDFANYELPPDVELRGYPARLIRQMVYQLETREVMDVLIRNNLLATPEMLENW